MHICFSVINTVYLQEYMKRHEPSGNEMKGTNPKIIFIVMKICLIYYKNKDRREKKMMIKMMII